MDFSSAIALLSKVHDTEIQQLREQIEDLASMPRVGHCARRDVGAEIFGSPMHGIQQTRKPSFKPSTGIELGENLKKLAVNKDCEFFLEASPPWNYHSRLNEQLDQLAKRIETSMSQAQDRLLQRLVSSHDMDAADASDHEHDDPKGDRPKLKRMSGSHIFETQEKEDSEHRLAAQIAAQEAEDLLRQQSSSYADISGYRWREGLRTFLTSPWCEMFIAAAIMVNSIYIGIELEYMVAHNLQKTPRFLAIINHTFTGIFTVEIVARILAEGPAFVYSRSRWIWNMIDSTLVIFALLESFFDIYQSRSDDDRSGVSQLGNARVLRLLRLTRILRILRVSRMLKFLRTLATLVFSIMCTLRSLVWSMLLLLIIIYVFALAFTQAATDHLMELNYLQTAPCDSTDPMSGEYLCVLNMYWGNLLSSMFTLFKTISGGISWDIVVQPLHDVSSIWAGVFVCYVSFTYLGMLNVITGVFCESALEAAQNDNDLSVHNQLQQKEMVMKRIRELFMCIDNDGSGSITFDELWAHIQDKEVIAFFEAMELTPSDAWTLFKLLDNDRTNVIDVEEFVEGVFRLRGTAKSIDIAKLMHDTKWMLKNVNDLAKYMHTEMSWIHKKLKSRPVTKSAGF